MDVHGRMTGVVEEDGDRSSTSLVLSNQSASYVATVQPPNAVDDLRKRLGTYSDWRNRKSPMQLATAGFIYTGIADKVECQSCGIRLYNWQEDEDPLQAHKKYAPDCEFMLKNFPHVKAPTSPKKVMHVKYPHYSDYLTLLRSFDSWPLKCVAQKPEVMAKSGFFYIGSADRARCFHCGITLRDWDTDDYPPCVHRQWSENCPHVQTLNVEAMKAEIEEAERLERSKHEYDHSEFIDCHSDVRHSEDIVTDGVSGATSTAQVHSGISDCSTDDTGFNPAIQAVVEMGCTRDTINKALEIRRRHGFANPDAKSLLETIFDLET